MMYAVYKITCRANSKNYYGSTNNMYHRRIQHLSKLKDNIHPNIHLQRAYNKYGSAAFYFTVMYEFKTKEESIKKEQEFLDAYIVESFNLSATAKSPYQKGECNSFYGHKHSEDSKLKMRNAKLGKPSAMAKPIITDKGIFKSIALACSYHGIQISTYYRRLNKNKTDWVTV